MAALLVILFYGLGAIVLFLIIRTAVLSALRQFDRERRER